MIPPFIGVLVGNKAAPVRLNGTDAAHSRTRVGTCVAGVSLNANGNEYAYSSAGSATGTLLQTWLTGGDPANFYVRCTLNSGTLDGANSGTGSWLQMNVTRGWAISDASSGDGADTGQITLEIAGTVGGSPVYATETYDLSAENVT